MEPMTINREFDACGDYCFGQRRRFIVRVRSQFKVVIGTLNMLSLTHFFILGAFSSVYGWEIGKV